MNTILQSKQNLAQQYRAFINHLFDSVDDLDACLRCSPPARIADIGCGVGWSSIGIAKAYPQVRVDGFDADSASIEEAWVHARQAKLTDRITFHVRDAGDGILNGRYDLVTAFEPVLNMSSPLGVLATMRRLAGKNGTVIIVDKHIDDTLCHYALKAGFYKAEILLIENDYFRFYRLYQDGN